MNIESVSKHVQRIGNKFDVIVENNGKTEVLYKNHEPFEVSELLNEVVQYNKPNKLMVQTKKRNGSTFLLDRLIEVDMNSKPATMGMLAGIGLTNDFKDYIINDLKDKSNKLETKCDRLEKENEQLKKDNFEQEKELKFKDKEFEIAVREKESETSGGLAGIMETVSNNPALANIAVMAIGRLMGVAMPQMGEAEEAPKAEIVPETQPQTPNHKIAKFISDWIIKVDEATATKFFELSRILAQKTNYIPDTIDFLKNLKQQTNESN